MGGPTVDQSAFGRAVALLLKARQDKFGHVLDRPLIGARAEIGEHGLLPLGALAIDSDPRIRTRALDATAKTTRDVLGGLADAVVQDPSAEVRLVGIRVLPDDREHVAKLMLNAPEPVELGASVATHGLARPQLIMRVLSDDAPEVLVAGMALLLQRKVSDPMSDLAPNPETWARPRSDVQAV